MRRRDLIALLAGAAVDWRPSAAWAQASSGRPLIGCLMAGAQDNYKPMIAAFSDGLREFGDIDGQSCDIAYRFADGRVERLPALADALAQLKPDVILAATMSAALATKKAAPSVPIVATLLSDPVRLGLIASYAHPGGMVTGIQSAVEGMDAKLLELAVELVPGATRIGLLVNVENASNPPQRQEIEAAGAARRITIVAAEIRRPDDLAPAFRSLASAGVQAVIVLRDALMQNERRRVADLAASARLPTVAGTHDNVEAGGLISYGVDVAANYRRAAYFVDKILKGARPADLPVEFPTKLEMVINLKTAKALGLTIPPAIMLRADAVIE